MDARLTGAIGESLAAQDYRARGYEVLDNNYRTRQGELDVILFKDDTVVFLEVKTRSENSIAAPAEFVTATKQQKLLKAAAAYLQAKELMEYTARFDVAEVLLLPGEPPRVHCIENAFTA